MAYTAYPVSRLKGGCPNIYIARAIAPDEKIPTDARKRFGQRGCKVRHPYEAVGRICLRMGDGPSSTDGEISFGLRNPLAESAGRQEACADRPNMDYWGDLAQCPEGDHSGRRPLSPNPMFYFLNFFL